ncbi:MAG TPA: DUF4132 domain-containing protein [Bryobacteraceae bacterium]|nr:DUF4132 domain-containing protein [Bryobacteraceae bacterium]
MTFLSLASLPPDLQNPRIGATEKRATIPWLDPVKLPPIPIGDGWIDPDTALTLVHDQPPFRHALRKHSSPEALDRFAAEFCRQLPDSPLLYNRYMTWLLIGQDLGGPETAAVMAAAMTRHNVTPMLRHGAAYVLAEIGDRTHLPAMTLCLFRMEPGFYRNCVQEQFSALVKRLNLSPAALEDWTLPDEAEPAENAVLGAGQAARLERAMLTGHRWPAQIFDRRIARQPIMRPLAAGLVWGYFDDAGRILQAFLIGPAADYPAPPADATVGIVHPSHLSTEGAACWKERSRDLRAPFAQWSAPAHLLSPEEASGDRITRLPAAAMPAARLLCRLEALGWHRPKARCRLEFHTRPFTELGVTAVIRYSGIPLSYGGEWSDQSIMSCYFEKRQDRLPLQKVSPIAISAVLSDLQALSSAGRSGRHQ